MSEITAGPAASVNPKVNFYLLSSSDQWEYLNFVCRLTEKALQRNNHIYIHCPVAATADTLNSLLYSFRADSFLPHLKLTTPLPAEAFTRPEFPVYIGNAITSVPEKWLVINLSDSIYPEADLISEIVANDDSLKKSARQKFTAYRERGFLLNTHKV